MATYYDLLQSGYRQEQIVSCTLPECHCKNDLPRADCGIRGPAADAAKKFAAGSPSPPASSTAA